MAYIAMCIAVAVVLTICVICLMKSVHAVVVPLCLLLLAAAIVVSVAAVAAALLSSQTTARRGSALCRSRSTLPRAE
jgi:hypothetical protein